MLAEAFAVFIASCTDLSCSVMSTDKVFASKSECVQEVNSISIPVPAGIEFVTYACVAKSMPWSELPYTPVAQPSIPFWFEVERIRTDYTHNLQSSRIKY